MPEGFPIRNIHIEDKHTTVIAGEVTTRSMTPEEWAKYGPVKPNPRRISNKPNEERRSKPFMNRIDKKQLYSLLVEYGTDSKAIKQISAETGWSRVDITHLKDYKELLAKADQERLSQSVPDSHTPDTLEPNEQTPTDLQPIKENSDTQDLTSIESGEIGQALAKISNTLLRRKNDFDEIARVSVEANNVDHILAYIDSMRDRIVRLHGVCNDPVDIIYLREIFNAIGCAAVTALVITNRE